MIGLILDWLKSFKFKRNMRRWSKYMEVSPSAVLGRSFRLEDRFPREGIRVKIGDNSLCGATFIFESDKGCVTIGERSYIGGGTTLIARTGIKIGSDVTIAWGVWIYDHNSHSLNYKDRMNDHVATMREAREGLMLASLKDWSVVKSAPIVIEDRVWIGFNAIILKGVTIGEGSVVGAGAVVTRDVEPYTVVAGNPARVVKRLERANDE